MRALLALWAFAFAFSGIHGAKLPSYFTPRCSRSWSETELGKCVERLVNAGGLSALANGDKKLRIPSMRPLIVPQMALSQGTNQVGLNLTWEPAEIWGLGESKLSNMKLDFPNKKNSFDVLIPQFTLTGNYVGRGRVLLLPITGQGSSNITVKNLRVHYFYDWPLKKIADGKDHATIINEHIEITGADFMHCDFKGLFNGDPFLGPQMNAFLNENWRELMRELGPGLAEATGRVVRLVVEGLVQAVPIEDMFAP